MRAMKVPVGVGVVVGTYLLLGGFLLARVGRVMSVGSMLFGGPLSLIPPLLLAMPVLYGFYGWAIARARQIGAGGPVALGILLVHYASFAIAMALWNKDVRGGITECSLAPLTAVGSGIVFFGAQIVALVWTTREWLGRQEVLWNPRELRAKLAEQASRAVFWQRMMWWLCVAWVWAGTLLPSLLFERTMTVRMSMMLSVVFCAALLLLTDSDLARQAKVAEKPFLIHITSLFFGTVLGYLAGLFYQIDTGIGVHSAGLVLLCLVSAVYAVLCWFALSREWSLAATLTLQLCGFLLGTTAAFHGRVPITADWQYMMLVLTLLTVLGLRRLFESLGATWQPAWPTKRAGLLAIGWATISVGSLFVLWFAARYALAE